MKPILIIVAGGSASGKTTVVDKIYQALGDEDLIVIKHDDYYRDQSHLSREERHLTNYDHPSSLENELLYKDLQALLNGVAIDKPVYNFVTQTREEKRVHVEPKPIIILEGILALEDERVRELADIKVFVNCDDDLCIYCNDCVYTCPTDAIEEDNPTDTNLDLCNSCSLCINICGENARSFDGVDYYAEKQVALDNDMSRKEVEFFM